MPLRYCPEHAARLLRGGGWRGERIEEPPERSLGSVYNKEKPTASGWHANHVPITMVRTLRADQPEGPFSVTVQV